MQDNTQAVEAFKAAGQKVTGANMVSARPQNGRISRADLTKEDASATFEYEAQTGSLYFCKGFNQQMNVAAKKNLPDEEKCKSVASQFLVENKLDPNQKEQLAILNVGGVKWANKEKEIDMMKTVRFGRKIDGVPVTGPGSKILVNIGNDGEVLSVQRKWRDINSSGVQATPPGAMKTQAEAEKELAVLIRELFGRVVYKLVSVQKLYFDNDGKSIQPVYLMEAELTINSDGKINQVPFLQPISMLKNAPEKVGFDAKTIKAEAKAAQASIQTKDSPPPAPSGNEPVRE